MSKTRFIDAMAADADITKAAAKKALESFLENVSSDLANGERVSLIGFGSFSISDRAERVGRNPQTGKELTIPAKKVVRFKAGDDLDRLVNKK